MTIISVVQILRDEAATLEFAGTLARAVGDTAIIFLHGQLGAGKTTFSRGFLKSLGYEGAVKSPTYTLVEPYHLDGFSLFHFDLYRIHDPQELEFIGIRDYFAPHTVSLVEWPERGMGWLPRPDLSCYIEFCGDGREIKINASSIQGEEILKRLRT